MKKVTRKPAVDTAVITAVVAALQSAGLIPATAGNIKPASAAKPAKPATFTATLGSVTFTPDGRDGRYKGYTVVAGKRYYIRAYDEK
jgi:hypothetical protein